MQLHHKLIVRYCLMILLVNTSCGYLENDGIEFQEPISGNILVQKQENSQDTELVLKESEQFYAGLVENIDSVFYDSEKQVIWVKSIINDYNNAYYHITVLDSSGRNVNSAIQKKEISREGFIIKVNNKVANWTRSKK